MKKLVALALIGTLMVSAVGCSDSSSKKSSKKSSKDSIDTIDEEDDENEDKDSSNNKKDNDKTTEGNNKEDDIISAIDNGEPEEYVNTKKQTYLNESMPADSLSFIVKASQNYENNTFIGIKASGVADEMTLDSGKAGNDTIRVSSADNTEISFYLNDVYYRMGLEVESYSTTDSKTVEWIDNFVVEYKEDNYYVTATSIDNYIIYYKTDDNVWDDFEGESRATWQVFTMGYFDTVDDAKAKISEYKDFFYIETFTDEETISVCNYKDYTCFNDLMINTLNTYGLYIDSYNQIRFDNGEFKISAEDYDYKVEVNNGTYDSLDGNSYKVNGNEVYINGSFVKYNIGDQNVKITIPTNVEKEDSSIIEAIESVFS